VTGELEASAPALLEPADLLIPGVHDIAVVYENSTSGIGHIRHDDDASLAVEPHEDFQGNDVAALAGHGHPPPLEARRGKQAIFGLCYRGRIGACHALKGASLAGLDFFVALKVYASRCQQVAAIREAICASFRMS